MNAKKNKDNLKNEDDLKSKGDHRNKDELKIEDNLILKIMSSVMLCLRYVYVKWAT